MAVSSLDKAVATRLFRMLALSEQTEQAVKRDHASYAKLSLLSQQMSLLHHQAQTVVDKVEKRAASESVQLSERRLALSSEYDEGANRLCAIMNLKEETVASIKRDSGASARMSLLAEQVGLLQQQAKQAVDESKLNKWLSEIVMSCRVVPGTVYYLYTQNGKDVLSRIAHDEWDNYEEYHGKFLYDYDFTFRKMEGEDCGCDWHMAADCLRPQAKLLALSGRPVVASEPKALASEEAGVAFPAAPFPTILDALMTDAVATQVEANGQSEPLPTGTNTLVESPICRVLSRWSR